MRLFKNGKTRTTLSEGKDGPALDLLDENGKTIWQTPPKDLREAKTDMAPPQRSDPQPEEP